MGTSVEYVPFAWGHANTWKLPWAEFEVRELDAARHIEPSDDEESDHIEARGYIRSVPSPAEWVQVSRRYRDVMHVTTKEIRTLSRGAFKTFRERGGDTPIGREYRLTMKEFVIPVSERKKEELFKVCSEGWTMGFEGRHANSRRIFGKVYVSPAEAVFAHIGALFRLLLV